MSQKELEKELAELRRALLELKQKAPQGGTQKKVVTATAPSVNKPAVWSKTPGVDAQIELNTKALELIKKARDAIVPKEDADEAGTKEYELNAETLEAALEEIKSLLTERNVHLSIFKATGNWKAVEEFQGNRLVVGRDDQEQKQLDAIVESIINPQ